MIYDCVTFFNELELLEMRLRILDEVVDRFVVCEAPFTFRCRPKALYGDEARRRFARWADRLVWLTYPGPPDPDPWANEYGQRDYLATALADCAPDDLVLIGDCDEIPDPRNVGRRPAPGRIVAHVQRMSEGYFNRVYEEPWFGTRAIAAGDIARYQTLSLVRRRPIAETEQIAGGWHFTSLGGAAVMQQKMQAYSHDEYDVPYYTDRFRLEETYTREFDRCAWVPFDDAFPRALHEEPRWSAFVWAKPPAHGEDETRVLLHAHGCYAYVPPDAPAVYAVTPDAALWSEAGKLRFGERFGGAFAEAGQAAARAGGDAWVVIDGFERERTAGVRALGASGAGIVAYVRNARSFSVFDAVLRGGAYPPGRALGPEEIAARLAALGWSTAAVDRVATYGVFAVFGHMPERLYGVEVGAFTFPELERAALQAFLAQAFVYTFAPRAGGP